MQVCRRKKTKGYKHLLCDINLGRDNLVSVTHHREACAAPFVPEHDRMGLWKDEGMTEGTIERKLPGKPGRHM